MEGLGHIRDGDLRRIGAWVHLSESSKSRIMFGVQFESFPTR